MCAGSNLTDCRQQRSNSWDYPQVLHRVQDLVGFAAISKSCMAKIYKPAVSQHKAHDKPIDQLARTATLVGLMTAAVSFSFLAATAYFWLSWPAHSRPV